MGLFPDLFNISKFPTNPFYLSLIVYVLILIIILYTFNQSNVEISNHIKFFVYTYLVLIIYTYYINQTCSIKLKQDYKLQPNIEIAKEVIEDKK
jgi:type II secretory pathway component PulF